MESTLTLLLTCLLLAYIIPAYKRHKKNRYWSKKQIDKRFEREEKKRKREFQEWYNEVAERYKKEWSETQQFKKDTTSI